MDLLPGELQKTAKKIKLIFQKQKFTTRRCCCPLEETTDVTTVFLKLQTPLYSVMPGKIQKKDISTEGSHAAGCAVLHQVQPQPCRGSLREHRRVRQHGWDVPSVLSLPCVGASAPVLAQVGMEEGLTQDLEGPAVPLLLENCFGALQAGVAPPQLLSDEAIEDVEADDEQDEVGGGDPEHGGRSPW